MFLFPSPWLWEIMLGFLVACVACARDVGDWLYLLFYLVDCLFGLLPFPMFLGEVLSIFCLSIGLCSCSLGRDVG